MLSLFLLLFKTINFFNKKKTDNINLIEERIIS